MKTSCFSRFRLLITISCLTLLVGGLLPLEAGRDKLPITKSKVTGSILELIKFNESLREENDRLKAQETSHWLVVNQTKKPFKLSFGKAQDIVVDGYASQNATFESEKVFKPGDVVNLILSGEEAVSLTLQPGKVVELGKGVIARIDFLSGSGAWLVLVTAK